MSAGAVAQFGRGPERAVALHCSLARGRAWSGVGEVLADRLTLTAPDLLGHGAAPVWSGEGDYAAQALGLVAPVLDGAAPAHLIGHSFGAVLALRLAALAPAQITRLTLIEPVWFAAAEGGPGAADHAVRHAELRRFADAGQWDAACAAFTAHWGDGTAWAALPERKRARMAAQMPLVMAQDSLISGDLGLLPPGQLEALTLDVLLVAGGESPPVVAEILDTLAARLPRVRRVTVPGAGHMVPLTHPESVGAEIAAQIDSDRLGSRR